MKNFIIKFQLLVCAITSWQLAIRFILETVSIYILHFLQSFFLFFIGKDQNEQNFLVTSKKQSSL
jgi:hypothetical protein